MLQRWLEDGDLLIRVAIAAPSDQKIVVTPTLEGGGHANWTTPSLLAPQPIIAKAGTSITYTTTSTLASTGCTTVPQYTIFAKPFF